MADYDLIPINASAEKLEKLAQMDINSSVLDEESNDNSLPTSKLVFEEFKKINENNKFEVDLNFSPESENPQSGIAVAGGLYYKLGVWDTGVIYRVGERVIAKIRNNDTGLENTVILECIQDHIASTTNGPVNVVEKEDFEQIWNVIPIKIDVSQTYNPESENAQSGKAVAKAIQPKIELWKPNTHYKVGDVVLGLYGTLWYTDVQGGVGYTLSLICTCVKEHVASDDFVADLDDNNLWVRIRLNADKTLQDSLDEKGNVIHTTYATKEEVNDLMSGGLKRQVVETLPAASSENTNIIYMLKNTSSNTQNVYDEYISTLGEDGKYYFELIGSTAVDLTDYVTKEELASKTLLWKPNTNYNVGDIVIAEYNHPEYGRYHILMKCKVKHRSSDESIPGEVAPNMSQPNFDDYWEILQSLSSYASYRAHTSDIAYTAYYDSFDREITQTYATKEDLNTAIGDIDTALDEIIALQNSIIGGE